MEPDVSSFYPPRARGPRVLRSVGRWWGRVTRSVERGLRHAPLPDFDNLQLSPGQLILCFVVPGKAYAVLRNPLLGKIFLWVWLVAAFVVLQFLGYQTLTGWAIGIMVSAHSSGVGALLLQDRYGTDPAVQPSLWTRIWVPTVVWVLMAMAFYWPLLAQFQKYVAKPLYLRVEDRVLVLKPWGGFGTLRRGDTVGCRLNPDRQPWLLGVRIAEGFTVGRVQALAGDTVEFSGRTFRVNQGPPQPSLPFMPSSGVVQVPGQKIFVWPDLQILVNRLGRGPLEDAHVQAAQVGEIDFVGRPYERWLFRKQSTR